MTNDIVDRTVKEYSIGNFDINLTSCESFLESPAFHVSLDVQRLVAQGSAGQLTINTAVKQTESTELAHTKRGMMFVQYMKFIRS